MASIETLIEQVRAVLIQTEDSKPRHEIYNHFVNEAKANNLSEDDFYKKVLKAAHKSIDWKFIEEQKQHKEREKKEKEEKEKAIELELEELKKHIQHAPKFIDRLVKTAFDDNVVERKELISIFERADRLSQDTYELAERISGLLEEKNFKAYPKANYDLPSLRQTLCSADWHSEERYLKLTTPPPPPPEPFPWKMLITAVLLIGLVGGSATYIFYLKPKWRDEAAPRYYVFAQNVTLRSSPIAGVDHNKLESLNYGAELITYDKGVEWYNVKSNGKEGYISAAYALDSADFYLLNSIFGDTESKGAIESSKCRKALLNYFKNKNYVGKMDDALQRQLWGSVDPSKEIWQVFSKFKDIKPNSFIYPRIVNSRSKFTDFGVIIKNPTSGNRKFLLFSFNDEEIPYLVNEQDAPQFGDIKDIRKFVKGGKIVYEVKYTSY
jgi:hypothetical protein